MQVQTCFGDKFVFVKVPSHVFLFSRIETMSLDTYTQNIPLTQKARYINIIKWGYFVKHMKTIIYFRFWSNYVAALKGKEGTQ